MRRTMVRAENSGGTKVFLKQKCLFEKKIVFDLVYSYYV